jgi:hypothetical protein
VIEGHGNHHATAAAGTGLELLLFLLKKAMQYSPSSKGSPKYPHAAVSASRRIELVGQLAKHPLAKVGRAVQKHLKVLQALTKFAGRTSDTSC